MNQKTKYWVMGAAAIIIIALIWFFAANGGSDNNESVTESGVGMETGNASNNTAMDHSTTAETGTNSTDLTAYIDEQNTVMMDMMDGMKNIPLTGNAALDYLHGMIPHHESAVSMAESYLKYGGENQELKKLAEDIISVQKTEIADMNAMISELEGTIKKDEEKEAAYLEEYNKMFDDPHSHHMDTSGIKTVEEAFCEGMISHHQMAVDMSQAVLNHTDEENVRKLADNIIKAQEQEITQMQDILAGLRK